MTDLAAMTATLSALDRLLGGTLPLQPVPVTHVHPLPGGGQVTVRVDDVTVSHDPAGDGAIYETCEFTVALTHDGATFTGQVDVGNGVGIRLDDGDRLPDELVDELDELFTNLAVHDGPAPLVAQLQAAVTLQHLHDLGQRLAHQSTVVNLLAHCSGTGTAATLAADWSGTVDELVDATDRLERTGGS